MRDTAYSLRKRLLGWLLVSTFMIGLIALVDTYQEAVSTANKVADRVLSGSALAIAERVVVSEHGDLEVDIPYVALEMLTSAAQDRVFYRVDGPPEQFITGYETLPLLKNPQNEDLEFGDGIYRGEQIRLVLLRRSASTGVNSVPFTVTVAETTMARRQLTQTILLRSALRLLFMIVGTALVVWIAVTYALRPLYRLSDAIAERNPQDLHPISEHVPDEVQGLVETVNFFMVRLQSALDALRHFTGNASHQLRTPLAVVRTQLALAQRTGDRQAMLEAVAQADQAVAHAERILAQLLLLAKIDASGDQAMQLLMPVDLAETARQITGDYVRDAALQHIDLGYDGEDSLIIQGDRLLLEEALKNLISNALLYAGAESMVTVRVRRQDDCACLEVEDNGAGVPEDKLALIRKRFDRGATSKNAQHQPQGSGLGLSIVEEIAALHGGDLRLQRANQSNGLLAIIRLPLNI
ncbi:MAG: sensor histidine kinase [Brucellaceae bacterium]|jgi:two-component system sensor histidine kinase TctE|nr:sensor histidine kinase [Brucellaceae bacterium]